MKNVFGVVSAGCVVALMAALVPAMASGASATAPGVSAISVDERKKPKPTKTPKPTKKPKPTKSPTPTATPSPLAPVPIQAHAIQEWINAQPKTYESAEPTFTYIVQPSLVGTDWVETAKRGAKAAFEAHALLGQPITRAYRVYLGWDWAWLREVVPRADCPAFYEPSDAGICPGSDVIYLRFSGFTKWQEGATETSTLSPTLRPLIVSMLGHELTHQVQTSLYTRSGPPYFPEDDRWPNEGWAEIIVTLVIMRVYDKTYAEARDLRLRISKNGCEGTKLRDLLSGSTSNGCEYVRGLLAYEYLMWKTGNMQAGWTLMSQSATTARESFNKAFPIDMDAFMDEADAYADQELILLPLRPWPR